MVEIVYVLPGGCYHTSKECAGSSASVKELEKCRAEDSSIKPCGVCVDE